MSLDRSIKVAFEKLSGKVLEADEIFEKVKDGFIIRKKYHNNEIQLFCCECQQQLSVSTSKYDRLHFKHKPKAAPCILKDSKFTPMESEQISNYFKSKESDRHKYLKNSIAEKISKIKGVNEVFIDNKFVINPNERRKPDVLCNYFDKTLVFEIQLSKLSLRYILSRFDFYLRNNMYLIWILDDFDIHGQNQTERDIKYLNEYQNFFKFDESSNSFKLLCKYKYPFLSESNVLKTKWLEKSVALEQLKFSESTFQMYYFDFENKFKEKEVQRIKIEQKKAKELIEKEEQKKIRIAKIKSEEIIELLIQLWKNKLSETKTITEKLKDLSEFELNYLNGSQPFQEIDGQPQLHRWFKSEKSNHFRYLEFILESHFLEKDVNQKSSDNKSLLQTLFENKSIDKKYELFKLILSQGYQFKKEDEIHIQSFGYSELDSEWFIILCYLSNQLNRGYLTIQLFKHQSLIFTIESAKRKEIVGFRYKPNQWVAFANNAIHSYGEYWYQIELAFKHYQIWDLIIAKDKRGTFQRKINDFYSMNQKQNHDCEWLIHFLYPEIEN